MNPLYVILELGATTFFVIAAVFALALGILQFGGRDGGRDIAKDFLDELPTGTLLTDRKARIVYANRAYGQLTGAASSSDCTRAPGSGTWPSTSRCSCSRRSDTTCAEARPGRCAASAVSTT